MKTHKTHVSSPVTAQIVRNTMIYSKTDDYESIFLQY